MNLQSTGEEDLGTLEGEFHQLLAARDREELVRCIRLLGMYLALYKNCYGEIGEARCAALLDPLLGDGELAALVGTGLLEASAMLRLVGGDRVLN